MTLLVSGITKRFGNLVANDGIDLELPAGTLHSILGENGAGKSTLMKILSGIVSPDSGSVSLDGKPVTLGSPQQALTAGIGMLHQEPLVCLPFTAAENFRLGSRRSVAASSAELIETGRRFGFRLDPSAVTRGLSVGERQQLEIVRLLAAGIKVLILDEPTSGITVNQRRELFAALHGLAREGLTVLFVSHKLEEVNELCASVTVLRRGRVVGTSTLPRREEDLVDMMFEQGSVIPTRAPATEDGPLVAELVSVDAGDERTGISQADLQVKEGEVIGLAGLEGSGQGTVLRALAGTAAIRRGQVRMGGRDITHLPARRSAEAGVSFLPGGRLEEGLLPGLTITEHIELAADSARFVNWDASRKRASEAIDAFRIKGSPDSVADELSGGNQQRLLLALLPPKLKLLLMEHPTRGLDLDSAAYVWSRLLDRRRHGTAIIFASADLDELLTYSDRILVLFEGRIIARLNARDTDAEEIGTLIGGRVAV
jgi:general nucleoside transport system ATP-binding protein